MACVGLWIPSLTRLLLYFGTKRMISLASACNTGMAARALSRVMMVVLSDVFSNENDLTTLSMTCLRSFESFAICLELDYFYTT